MTATVLDNLGITSDRIPDDGSRDLSAEISLHPESTLGAGPHEQKGERDDADPR